MASATYEGPTRFGDWRLAIKSIVGFWAVYFVTVVVRAFLGGDPMTVLQNKIFLLLVGVPLNVLVYLVIAASSRRASARRLAVVALGASFLAAVTMSAILIAAERYMEKPQDEMHFVSTEGYRITELGNATVIERPGHPPLTVTWPQINKLQPWIQFRIAADNAVIWLFFFAAWSAFYIALVSQRRAHDLRRRASAAEAAAQAAQVRALRYQVNPHFLFNTLNSLSSLVMTGRNERAEEMLLALSTFFRTSLSLNATADVTLAEEIELQRLYLDIEKVRFPSRLNVEIDIPAELQQARLPALILQPVVENAIKYGVSRSRKKVTLAIVARRLDPGRFEIRITNSSEPDDRAKKNATEGTGVGLANVSQRLEARFGAGADCQHAAIPGGYEVRLTIPFERGDG